MTIDKLDFTKPPPGYSIDEQDGEWDWSKQKPEDGNAHLITTEAGALAAAWEHYEARNDPPGLVTASAVDDEADVAAALNWHVIDTSTKNTVWWRDYPDNKAGEDDGQREARAAAWRWYKAGTGAP
jgi:hypothetical protein